MTRILLDERVPEGQLPVRLEPPVDASSAASELEAWIRELEAFRPAVDHLEDLEILDYQIELGSIWLARATGRDSVHRSGTPSIARRNGKGVTSSEP